MIEETRIRLGLMHPNWLPIAVTFNHKSNVDYAWKDPSIIVAFAVCCRMIAAVYNIPLDEAQKRMGNALAMEGSESIKTGGSSFALNLIVGTVQHIAGRVKKVKPAVDSLVLFIDESVKLLEFSDSITGISDGYALLQRTILGERVGNVLKTSLVMSSLSVSVFEAIVCERRIVPIVLASKLSVDHIVDNIWIPSLPASYTIDATERAMLKWLAASVSVAPRLVELIGTALQSTFVDTWPAGLSLGQSMGAVLSEFDQSQKMYYGRVRFPVGKYLHALINEKPIAMDNTVLRKVRSSSFTNSIKTFPGKKEDGQLLVLEAALYFLANTSNYDWQDEIATEIQKEFNEIWNSILNHIKFPLSPPIGQRQPLEDAFARVLRMRILSSHLSEHSPGQTTLQDLLAIDDINAIKYTVGAGPYQAAKISSTETAVVQAGAQKNLIPWEADSDESSAKRKVLSHLLSREIIATKFVFIRYIRSSKQVDLTEWKAGIRFIDSDVLLTKPSNHSGLMLFGKMALGSSASSPSDREKIVLIFEEKSQGETEGGQEKPSYDRYEAFCAMVAGITESELKDDKGYLRALMEGRFLYVYVTMQSGPVVYLAREDWSHAQANSLGMLVLNRDVTKRILGTVFDVYALARSSAM
eukprot:gene23318-biopygen15360